MGLFFLLPLQVPPMRSYGGLGSCETTRQMLGTGVRGSEGMEKERSRERWWENTLYMRSFVRGAARERDREVGRELERSYRHRLVRESRDFSFLLSLSLSRARPRLTKLPETASDASHDFACLSHASSSRGPTINVNGSASRPAPSLTPPLYYYLPDPACRDARPHPPRGTPGTQVPARLLFYLFG